MTKGKHELATKAAAILRGRIGPLNQPDHTDAPRNAPEGLFDFGPLGIWRQSCTLLAAGLEPDRAELIRLLRAYAAGRTIAPPAEIAGYLADLLDPERVRKRGPKADVSLHLHRLRLGPLARRLVDAKVRELKAAKAAGKIARPVGGYKLEALHWVAERNGLSVDALNHLLHPRKRGPKSGT